MLLIKSLHVLFAGITVLGFMLRFYLRLVESPLSDARWVKTLPHIIDTLLLGFGVTMAIYLSISPLEHAWLMAKVMGLLAYIGFGVLAMRASNSGVQWFGFGSALLCVTYIIVVAYTKQTYL